MLDWFSGSIGYDASQLELGRVLMFDSNGEILRDSPTWETARSSHDTSIQICSTLPTHEMLSDTRYHCSQGPILRVSGNPVKYLQGHNVFGPSSSKHRSILQQLARSLPAGLKPMDVDVMKLPAVHNSTIDTNVMIDLKSHELVHQWINSAAQSTRSHHGRAMGTGSTVYWGKNSKRWSLKAYCKHCEMKKHRNGLSKNLHKELLTFTNGLLRIELRLKRLELKDRGPVTENDIWDYWDRITIGILKHGIEAMDMDLSNSHIRTLQLWAAGYEPIKTMPHRSFYRHRKSILEGTGIDIANPKPEKEEGIDSAYFEKGFLKPRAVTKIPKRLEKHLLKVT